VFETLSVAVMVVEPGFAPQSKLISLPVCWPMLKLVLSNIHWPAEGFGIVCPEYIAGPPAEADQPTGVTTVPEPLLTVRDTPKLALVPITSVLSPPPLTTTDPLDVPLIDQFAAFREEVATVPATLSEVLLVPATVPEPIAPFVNHGGLLLVADAFGWASPPDRVWTLSFWKPPPVAA